MKDAGLIAKIAERIDASIADGRLPAETLEALVLTYGAKHRYARGTHELLLAEIYVTSTAGVRTLINAWRSRAHRFLLEQAL